MAHLGACRSNERISILLLTAMHDYPHDVLHKPLRAWRAIAEELIREPSTERMGMLLKELILAFEGQPFPREEARPYLKRYSMNNQK
jgi:hypothetical protein